MTRETEPHFRFGFAGISSRKDVRPWSSLARAIGRLIGERGHSLTTGGCSGGVSELAARAFRKARPADPQLFFYLPQDGEESRVTYNMELGQPLLCVGRDSKQRRRVMARQIDVLLTINGGEGTADECAACDESGTPVLPIGATEGTSREWWEKIRDVGAKKHYRGSITDDEFAQLGSLSARNDVEELASHAVRLAERIVRAAHERRGHAVIAFAKPSRIFVVHGRNLQRLEEVKRYLTSHKLTPVVLAEQPGAGRSELSNFLTLADGADGALVLMTADDVAHSARDGNGKRTAEPKPEKRARQNVILELGYFLCRLGSVIVLHEPGVEIPSDYHGIRRVELQGNDWTNELTVELQNTGLLKMG